MKTFKNIVSYFSSEVVIQIIGFATLPVFAKYLSPKDFGIISLVLAFTGFFGILVGLGLSSGLGRIYFDYGKKDKKIYYSTIMLSGILISLVFCIILHLNGTSIILILFPKSSINYYPFFLLGTISLFFDQIAITSTYLLKSEKEGRWILRISIITTILSLFFKIKFIVFDGLGAYGALLTIAFLSFFKSILLFYATRNFFAFNFNYNMLKKTFPYAFPLIFYGIGGYLFRYSDRIVLEKFVPISLIGFYHIADRLSSVMKFLVNAINDALSPDYLESSIDNFKKTMEKYKNYLTIWFVCISIFFLILDMSIELYIRLFFPKEYYFVLKLVPFLIAAYVFRGFYCFFINPIFFLKKVMWIPIITVFAGIANIIINILFIPKYGIIIAACSTMIAFIITALFAYALSKKFNAISVDWSCISEIFFLGLTSALLFYNLKNSLLIDSAIKALFIIILSVYFYKRNYGGLIRPFARDFFHILRARVN
tara:strand:+ start:2399 stop:3847 length:1449 start_codon:yes stop_codon:yes gene_type:complete